MSAQNPGHLCGSCPVAQTHIEGINSRLSLLYESVRSHGGVLDDDRRH